MALFFEQKILFQGFVPHNINNKNTWKIVCKLQCLKNSLQFNISNGSISPVNPIPSNVFWPRKCWRGGDEITPIIYFWTENCYWLIWNLVHILSNLKTLKKDWQFLHQLSRNAILYPIIYWYLGSNSILTS